MIPRAPRFAPTLFAVTLALSAASNDAAARGGRLDDVPRPIGNGRDMPLVPPPPPPPSPRPRAPRPGEVTAPPVTVTAPRRPRPRSYEDWTWWYAHDRECFEDVKSALLARDPAPSSLVAPVLRRHVASGPHVVRAAACIALGKVAEDATSIALLRTGLDREAGTDPFVHESAAIGLGLLRRTPRAAQLSASELDAVRTRLSAVVEDPGYASRTRAVAAVSLGLLGDQPTGDGGATTTRLFGLLEGDYAHPDLVVGLLIAIGGQPPTSVTHDERAVLARAALAGRLGMRGVTDLTRARAAEALGRVGTREDVPTLARILGTRRGVGHDLRRSAALALGTLGHRLDGEARVDITRVLLAPVERREDISTRAFATLSLAELVAADLEAGEADVLEGTQAEARLIEIATRGRFLERPFGALALGMVAAAAGRWPNADAPKGLRDRVLEALRAGWKDTTMDGGSRAAFALGLGLARDATSVGTIRAVVTNPDEDGELRSHAAVALGMIGDGSEQTVRALGEALAAEAGTPLHRSAAVALARLGHPLLPGPAPRRTSQAFLLDLLPRTVDPEARRRLVRLLGQVGDDEAVKPLVSILEDEAEDEALRAQAAAALGQIADLEVPSSLDRLRHGTNPRTHSDLIVFLSDLL